MIAKDKFREGWIMLLRPFRFAELSKPLQKMTIVWAYAERPVIEKELNDKGKELKKELDDNYGKVSTIFENSPMRKSTFETESNYHDRIEQEYNRIFQYYNTKELYKGEIVQTYIEGNLTRFYPEEYSIISKETFEAVINEPTHDLVVNNPSVYQLLDVKTKVHYLQSRGISEERAKLWVSSSLKDNVYFTPCQELLEIFCREEEIY